MSALPPKADMLSVEIDVYFVPLADVRYRLSNRLSRPGTRDKEEAAQGRRPGEVRKPLLAGGNLLKSLRVIELIARRCEGRGSACQPIPTSTSYNGETFFAAEVPLYLPQ